MIGRDISRILTDIEEALLEFEENSDNKPNYTIEGFRAATKIFMSVLMDKQWELQEKETMQIEDRILMVTKAGEDIRKIIKIYTNIDTFDLYK